MKCHATTVTAARNGIETTDDAQTRLRPHLEPGFRGFAQPQRTDLWAYGCTSCGYVELYVVDPAGLAFMEQRWAPVPASSSG